jgi:hypothetical protein
MARNSVPSIVNLFIYSGLLCENGRWWWRGGGWGREFGFIYRSYEHVGGAVSSHLICPRSDLYMNKPNFLYKKKFYQSAFETFDKRRLAVLLIGRNISFFILKWNKSER